MEKKVIYAYLQGGLGNQLFIYAAARQLQISRLGEEGKTFFLIKKQWVGKIPILIQDYKLCSSVETSEDLKLPLATEIARRAVGFSYRLFKKPRQRYNLSQRIRKIAQRWGIVKCDDGYIKIEDKITTPIVMDGFFQSDRYFPEIRDNLIKEIVPKTPMLSKNIEIVKLIDETESVCISVRLGDYVNNSAHQVCTVNFYQRAINKMLELHPGSKFFLFSDDPQMAKEMLSLPSDTIFEEGEDPAYEALRVMSHCKHFIISNSSFHWWAQYLSTNKYKTVIAPDRWFNIDIPCDIYQDNWTIISAEATEG